MPDSIVPGISSQALNRYMYVMGNPINFKDPSGNKFIEDDMYDDPIKGGIGGIGQGYSSNNSVEENEIIPYWQKEPTNQPWEHFDEAKAIIQSPNTTTGQKMLAKAFIGGTYVGYGALGIGLFMLGYVFVDALIAEVGYACVGNPACNPFLIPAAQQTSTLIRNQNNDWADYSGMLRDAAKYKGNFGIGELTEAEAQILGEAWVGPNPIIKPNGIMISADKLRQFRPPSFKPYLNIYQANLEYRFIPKGQWFGNAHVDIIDLIP